MPSHNTLTSQNDIPYNMAPQNIYHTKRHFT